MAHRQIVSTGTVHVTILHAQTLPPDGGDTVFVNMYAAFDGLNQATKDKSAALTSCIPGRHHEHEGRPVTRRKNGTHRTTPILSLVFIRKPAAPLFLLGCTRAISTDGLSKKGVCRRTRRSVTRAPYLFRHKWQAGDLLCGTTAVFSIARKPISTHASFRESCIEPVYEGRRRSSPSSTIEPVSLRLNLQTS